jgi:hypothetical protein
MRKLIATRLITTRLIATVAMMALIAGPAAIAQTGTGSSTGATKGGGPLPAPVGHRQPRAGDVPNEKNLSNPNDPINREDAALDRKIKSICRGC